MKDIIGKCLLYGIQTVITFASSISHLDIALIRKGEISIQ